MRNQESDSQYIPVHFIYRAEFQLDRASMVQYKYSLYETKRDGTPNKWSTSSKNMWHRSGNMVVKRPVRVLRKSK